jgi:hypothetical protein
MRIIGLTTLDSRANINSKFAGVYLVFHSIFLLFSLKNMSKTEVLKFGSGFLHIVLSIIVVGFQ